MKVEITMSVTATKVFEDVNSVEEAELASHEQWDAEEFFENATSTRIEYAAVLDED